jgi:hypothetical protein
MLLSAMLLAGILMVAGTHISAKSDTFQQLNGNMLDKRVTFCDSQNISTMHINECECRDWGNGCSTSCVADSCGIPSDDKKVKSCSGGCTDDEAECAGCGLWFSSVCRCVKEGKCWPSGPIQPGGAPVWFVTKPTTAGEDVLITTNELLPGIVEMSRRDSAQHDMGWRHAQEHYNSSSQALAINSYRVRTEEQVHIHICNKRNTTTIGLLNRSQLPSVGHLVQIAEDANLHCLWRDSGGSLTSFASSLGDFFNAHPQDCWARIGAGIIRDDNNRIWGCATNNTKGPLEYFC